MVLPKDPSDSLTDEQKGALVKAHLESLAGKIEYDDSGAGGAEDDYDSDAGDGAGGQYYRTKPKKVHCYLNTMFPELKVKLKDMDLLELHEDSAVVDAMVRYIETGDVDITTEIMEGYFEMAFALDIDSVVNCWSMREQAIVCEDSRVLGIVNTHIKSHFDVVTNYKSFLEMPYKKIEKLFQDWAQIAPSENDVRHAFEKWVAYNPANRGHLKFGLGEGGTGPGENVQMDEDLDPEPRPSTSTTSTSELDIDDATDTENLDACTHCGEIVEPEEMTSHYNEHVSIWKHQLNTLMWTPRPPVAPAPAPLKVEPPKAQMQMQQVETQPEPVPEIIDLIDSDEESQSHQVPINPTPTCSRGFVPSGTAAATGGIAGSLPFQAYCGICDMNFPQVYEYTVHMQGKAHRDALRNKNKDPDFQNKAQAPKKLIDSRLSLPHATISKALNNSIAQLGLALSRQSLPRTSNAGASAVPVTHRSRGNRTLPPPRREQAHLEMESDRTCKICDHTYTHQRALKIHFQTNKHKLAVAEAEAIKKSKPNPIPGPSGSTNKKPDEPKPVPLPQPRVMVRCDVCELDLLHPQDLNQHENTVQHHRNLSRNAKYTKDLVPKMQMEGIKSKNTHQSPSITCPNSDCTHLKFQNPSVLELHTARFHTPISELEPKYLPFVCSPCNMSLGTLNNLKVHLASTVHNSNVPLPINMICPEPDCQGEGKVYRNANSLRAHMNSHVIANVKAIDN